MGPAAVPRLLAWPVARYDATSSSLQAPMPVFLSELMLNAFQPAVTAPANFLRLSGAKARLRGVWHSPQCASAAAREAPRFHSGLCAVLGAKRIFGLNASDQKNTDQR